MNPEFLVDNTTFLTKLTELFSDKKGKGTIWLTHKRYIRDGENDVRMDTAKERDEIQEYPCLLRATDGKTIHFSTKVNAENLEKFHAAYGALLKASMTTTLRKRDKKREKQRAEQQAARKRKLAEPVMVEGPKRGNGRRKRQRSVKAALRLEESKKKAAEQEELKSKGRDG